MKVLAEALSQLSSEEREQIDDLEQVIVDAMQSRSPTPTVGLNALLRLSCAAAVRFGATEAQVHDYVRTYMPAIEELLKEDGRGQS